MAINKVLMILTFSLTTLAGCGGGDSSSSPNATLSADQSIFESNYVQPAAAYSVTCNLPSSGTPTNSSNYFYYSSVSTPKSPLNNGGQNVVLGNDTSFSTALSVPAPIYPTRYIINGHIASTANTTGKFSYSKTGVTYTRYDTDGVTPIFSQYRYNFQSVPLTGLMVSTASSATFICPQLFSNSALIRPSANWLSGSSLIEFSIDNLNDIYLVYDSGLNTTGVNPTPLATNTTIAALMAAGGIIDGTVTHTMANGTVSIIQGVYTYVASTGSPSQVFRTYYNYGGNVLIGELFHPTVMNFGWRINQAAINSLQSAILF